MGKIIAFLKDWKNQKSYVKWLMKYSKPYLPKISILLVFDVLSSLLTVGLALISKQIIDSATGGNILVTAIVMYIIIILVSQGIDVLTSMMSVMLNEKFSFGIRKQIYEKIIHSHWLDVTKYHTGDLMTRLTSDAGSIAEGIVVTIPTMIRLVVELLVTFFTLFYFEPLLAILSLLMGPVAAITSMWFGKKLKKLQIKVQESEAAYRSFLQESLSNILIVKSFTNEEYSTNQLVKLRDERFYWVWKKSLLGLISSTVLSLSFHFGYIGAFAFGAYGIAKNTLTYGTMSVFLTLVNRVQAPLMSLAQTIPKIVSVLASAGRIIELQDIPEEVSLGEQISHEGIGVLIDNLTFGYNAETVLEDASVQINANEFVAIVGESGIGKTTLVRLIMSFVNDMGGSIAFHDTLGNIETVNAGIRNYIAYVPQGNTLFSGTIRENILMGKLDATEDEIVEALKMAACYDVVMGLPDKLDTVIGERGHGLSEGQAQRIAIARALIRKAPFLILDEATSALDEKTELDVLKGIQALEPKPTCLLITHRKSVLEYCNREICIRDKKLYEVTI